MRDIKFRLYSKNDKCFITASSGLKINLNGQIYADWLNVTDRYAIEQYTGFKDKNGKEIYEGDIFRLEVETDLGDDRDYAIVTYIKEWAMFATLLTGEYAAYMDEGAASLDEQMFWSYTLEDAKEQAIIGNIHDNKELLTETQVSQ